ncbi:MAG: hypothetical protein KTR13_07925 [Saprospiraceae bacterium]|nr:hypothetical protein [Saprospiraceae bacterium]
MDILKIANEWARDEIFSTRFFIVFAIVFIVASIGFWQLGKTATAKAFVFPTLVAGLLLMAVGVGLYVTNQGRLNRFTADFENDSTAFVQAELERAEKTVVEYENVVFKVIPLIIAAAALLIVFVDRPLWRAIAITTIAMMAVILLIDSNASARMQEYKTHLVEASTSSGIND